MMTRRILAGAVLAIAEPNGKAGYSRCLQLRIIDSGCWLSSNFALEPESAATTMCRPTS